MSFHCYLNSLSFIISTGSIPIGLVMDANRDLGGLLREGIFFGVCFTGSNVNSFFFASASVSVVSSFLGSELEMNQC